MEVERRGGVDVRVLGWIRVREGERLEVDLESLADFLMKLFTSKLMNWKVWTNPPIFFGEIY